MQSQGPADWPDYPFCSVKCRLIDLGRWLGEDYRIAAESAEEANPAEPGDNSEIP
jgi:endogenous inhibitor of DNA gyrase (YacG/DUF329 family)